MYWKNVNLPKTVAQAVEYLSSNMDKSELKYIKNTPEKDLTFRFHRTLGMDIRNNLGLWNDKSALRSNCRKVARGWIHVDDCSGLIIKRLWKSLQLRSDI